MCFVVSSVRSEFINSWHLRWEAVRKVVREETQESATGLYSLTRRMWCEPRDEDKRAEPRAALFHTTCSDFCLSLWPAGLDQALGRGGSRRKKRIRDHLFYHGSLTRPDSPLKPRDDIRPTEKSRLTSRLILRFETPLLELLRHGASARCSLFISRLFFFFSQLLLPYFPPRWTSHIKARLRISLGRRAANRALRNPSWNAGAMIKEETNRAVSEAPRPCLVLPSCW